MEKIAKLVLISLQTRVIVSKDATDDEIIKAAKPRFKNSIDCCAGDNIEEITDDVDCPYGTIDDDEIS